MASGPAAAQRAERARSSQSGPSSRHPRLQLFPSFLLHPPSATNAAIFRLQAATQELVARGKAAAAADEGGEAAAAGGADKPAWFVEVGYPRERGLRQASGPGMREGLVEGLAGLEREEGGGRAGRRCAEQAGGRAWRGTQQWAIG